MGLGAGPVCTWVSDEVERCEYIFYVRT
jgi:hypothetical protein